MLLSILTLITSTIANLVTFCNLDFQAREICWYPPTGYHSVMSDVVPPWGCITTSDYLSDGVGYQFHPVNQGNGKSQPSAPQPFVYPFLAHLLISSL